MSEDPNIPDVNESSEEQYGEPALWHAPGSFEPIAVREVGEDEDEDGRQLCIEVDGEFKWVPEDQVELLSGEEKSNQDAGEQKDNIQLTPEQQQAREVVIKYLNSRIASIKRREQNPKPDDVSRLAKLNSLVELADQAQFSERSSEGQSVLKYFLGAIKYEPEESFLYKQAVEVVNALENAGVDVSGVRKDADKEPAPEPPKDDKSKDSNQGNGGNKNGKNHNLDNADEPENTWLDPRLIQELKNKYDSLIENETHRRTYSNAKHEILRLKNSGQKDNKGKEILVPMTEHINQMFARDEAPVSQSFKDQIKQKVINDAINNRINRAEWLSGKGFSKRRSDWTNIGPIEKWQVEPPSDEIKRQMAEMMGWSANKLRELGIKEDERLNEQKRRFMPGQEVRIINSNDNLENSWKVKGYRGDKVLIENGQDVRRYSEDELRDVNEQILNLLKPYIDDPNKAKILTDEGIVKGQFQGYKISNKSVYIGDSKGNRIGKVEVPIGEFLSWQEKQTDEEILNDQEARLAPYIDKEYPVYKDDGSASTVKVEYDKERQKVTLTSPEGIADEYSIEEFLDNIKAVLDQYDRVDREFPTGERKFNLGQKVKGKSMGELSDGWTVEDFSRLANGEIWVTIKKDNTEKKVEQENLLSWQNSTEASGGDNGGSGNGGESSENDSENKKKKRTPKEETRLKPLENRLKELKQKKVRKSGIQFVQSKWKEHMSKYDVGETAKERKLNERKKRVRFILGGVALAPFFPLEVAVVVGASPLYLSDHYIQYRRRKNLHNKIHKQEVLIRDEEEQIRHENEKARQKERERQNVGS